MSIRLISPIVDFGTNTNFIGGKEIKIDTVVSGFASETNSKNLSSGDVIYNAISPSGEILVKDSTLKIASTKNDFIRNADNLSLKEFQDFIKNQTGEYTVFTYNLQYDQAAEKKVNVFFDKKSSRNVIGVYLSRVIFIDYGVTPLTKLFSGLSHSFNVLSYSTKTLYTLISYSFVTRDISAVSEGVSGPIGIYSVIDSLVASKASNTFFAIIDIAGIISLSLAFMNVLPIPALDGGRAVFVVFELIFKKKVKPSIESNIHKAGMSFLLLLLFLITIKDVVKLF